MTTTTTTTEKDVLEALAGPIAAFARRVSVRPDQQDDYEQEALLGAVLGFRAYSGRLEGEALRKVCLSCAFNRVRSLQRKVVTAEAAVTPDEVLTEREDGPSPADRVADGEKLDEALRLAGARWDVAEIVKEYLAYPAFRMEDLATALGVSRATVSRLLSRTREILVRLGRLEIEEREEVEEEVVP